ncbi:MAG: Kdo hydroxylase family protein [Isosphaeraceae bacterium]
MARISIDLDAARNAAPEDLVTRLESGDIIYFPETPIPFPPDDQAFLLEQKQVDASYHKNVSYRPAQDRLKGVEMRDAETFARTHRVMRDYSRRAVDFMAKFFPKYSRDWKIDFASYRPIEEQGRKVALRSRNDLLHVDSFPSRPSHGDRLLRIFSNINPTRPRVWITSDPFEQLAWQFGGKAGLPHPPNALSKVRSQALRVLSGIGLPVVDRPPYDQFMLRFHHFLKENESFQRDCPKDRWEFPPNSTWICFTDTTSHACLSGQFALEQTFIIRRGSLVAPERAPIAILERMAGFPLTGSGQARSA